MTSVVLCLTGVPWFCVRQEFRGFWVSWIDGYIKVGAGFKYNEMLLCESSIRAPHDINGLAVSSGSYDLEWEFESVRGTCAA